MVANGRRQPRRAFPSASTWRATSSTQRIEEGRGDHPRRHRRRRPLHLSPGAGARQPRRQRAQGARRRRRRSRAHRRCPTASSLPPPSSASSRSARWSPWSIPSCPTPTTSTTSTTRERARSSPSIALTDRIAPLIERVEAASRGVITAPAPAAAGAGTTVGRASPALDRPTTPRRTIRRCGCSPRARRASRRPRCTCTTTSPSTPSATPSRCCRCAPTTSTLGVPKLFFGYATGTNLMFPFAVGATTVLVPRARDAREAVRADARATRPTVLTSVPTMINKMVQAAGARALARAAARLHLRRRSAAAASSTIAGRSASASRSSTASARPSCSTSTSRTAPARCGPARSAGWCPATKRRSSAPTATPSPDGEIGTLWVKGDSAAHLLLAGAREVQGGAARRLGRLRRSVPPRRRRLLLLRRAAPTTCSRSAASSSSPMEVESLPLAPSARARGRGHRLRGRRRIG